MGANYFDECGGTRFIAWTITSLAARLPKRVSMPCDYQIGVASGIDVLQVPVFGRHPALDPAAGVMTSRSHPALAQVARGVDKDRRIEQRAQFGARGIDPFDNHDAGR